MKEMTFSEINDLENGQQVPSFKGTIKKVFDQKTGEGNYGPWWLQNIILQDEHANELTITWSCEDPFDAGCEGTQYLFEAGHDKKNQLVGLKREIREKNGKRYESLKVDDRAKVKAINNATTEQRDTPNNATSCGGGDPAEFGDGSPDTDWPEAPVIKLEAPPTNGDSGVRLAREHLMQAANLYNLCVACVEKSVSPKIPEVGQTSEMFQAAVGTLFIEASRAGFVSKMPSKPL